MAYTYNLANNTGKVRLLIQDTTSTAAAFADEEIGYFLTIEGTVRTAAAACLEAKAAKLSAALKLERIGEYQYDQGNSPSQLLEAAKKLREQDQADATFEIADDATNSFHIAGL